MSAEEPTPAIYTQYVAEITRDFLKEMKKEHGLMCEASGGSMPYDVEEISVTLIAPRNPTIDQARELIVMATERLKEMVNAHEKIRPYLREYPFPSSRADVSISFRNPKKIFSSSSNKPIIFVVQAKNRLFYRAENPDNPYLYLPIKDEPYEEALKLIYSKKCPAKI